jgi:hypothetical protein
VTTRLDTFIVQKIRIVLGVPGASACRLPSYSNRFPTDSCSRPGVIFLVECLPPWQCGTGIPYSGAVNLAKSLGSQRIILDTALWAPWICERSSWQQHICRPRCFPVYCLVRNQFFGPILPTAILSGKGTNLTYDRHREHRQGIVLAAFRFPKGVVQQSVSCQLELIQDTIEPRQLLSKSDIST